jgi:hypothetical protein
MKKRIGLPLIFIFTSSFALGLGAFLLVTKTTFHPQFFITTCGEVLKNIQEHVHFSPEGVLSSIILAVAFISFGMTLWQLIRFVISHWRLCQLQIIRNVPGNLEWVINKHDLSNHQIVLVNQGKLTAYTIGLFKPRIVISLSLIKKLSREQLEAVVLHELHHLRSRHVLWLLLTRLISSAFFFIPLINYLEIELAADAFVVEKQKTRDHLCGSLALNLQYAESVVPHFATSPIEKRVEYLTGNKLSFEWIGTKQLAISFLSLSLMLGIAFTQPRQITAELSSETGGICRAEKECQATDCSSHQNTDTHNFTPLVPAPPDRGEPASFSLSSSD